MGNRPWGGGGMLWGVGGEGMGGGGGGGGGGGALVTFGDILVKKRAEKILKIGGKILQNQVFPEKKK